MTTWPPNILTSIAKADDLHIAPYRAGGIPGTPTWIWSVTVDDALYVRAYNGTRSSWYRSAVEHRAGIIHAAGGEHEVTFTPVAPGDIVLQDRIDVAYHEKYDPSPYVQPMVSDRARAATVRVEPRG